MANAKFYVALGTILLFGHSIALASDFIAYEGRDAVQQGNGGEKKTVNGVDFWSSGAPPRKFKIIGYVTDRGPNSGLIGMIRMSSLESSIAKEAKKAGGDAVILMNSQTATKAHVSNTQTNTPGTANTSGTFSAATSGNSTTGTLGAAATTQGQSKSATLAVPVEPQHSKYAVIKYLADRSGDARAAAP
jgi:hypothetical protein